MNVILLFLFSFYAEEHRNVEPSSTPAILGVYTTQIINDKLKVLHKTKYHKTIQKLRKIPLSDLNCSSIW